MRLDKHSKILWGSSSEDEEAQEAKSEDFSPSTGVETTDCSFSRLRSATARSLLPDSSPPLVPAPLTDRAPVTVIGAPRAFNERATPIEGRFPDLGPAQTDAVSPRNQGVAALLQEHDQYAAECLPESDQAGQAPPQQRRPARNAQQLVNASRAAVSIKNWSANYEAQEAVLDSYYTNEVHTAPHGQHGRRVAAAVEYLKTTRGFKAHEQTMVSWVNAMLKAHKTRGNVQDGETGQERHNDLSPIQRRIRDLLSNIIEEQQDIEIGRTTAASKRQREEELRQGGLRHREDVARAMVGDTVTEVGGRAVALTDSGTVEEDNDADAGTRATKRKRRNPRHDIRIEKMLEKDSEQSSKLDERRLELEEKQFFANLDIRKEELALQRQQNEMRLAELKESNQLKRQEMAMRQQEFQIEMEHKRSELEKAWELKFKKLEVMLKTRSED
ncbi:hypothetical protein F442_18021 [Phytophthora nicotianae P10297]|uniref:Uncharacterized protein n=1 Tax=Phytophthora nicotianae P10297 TaxID=1317064 RepID=W2YEH7_PHYNI|nr:hypothetical protein F442_18021 [Phytophthora nicotianae P10297]